MKPSLRERLGGSVGMLGLMALAAWFALLWFMFSDVL